VSSRTRTRSYPRVTHNRREWRSHKYHITIKTDAGVFADVSFQRLDKTLIFNLDLAVRSFLTLVGVVHPPKGVCDVLDLWFIERVGSYDRILMGTRCLVPFSKDVPITFACVRLVTPARLLFSSRFLLLPIVIGRTQTKEQS
jgi:hypothetical protein